MAKIDTSSQRNFFLTENNITLTPKTGYKIARCILYLEGENKIPLYECNFDYSLEEKGKAFIMIPDFPEDSIKVSFTSPEKSQIKVNVNLYLIDENEKLFFQSESFFIEETQEKRNEPYIF